MEIGFIDKLDDWRDVQSLAVGGRDSDTNIGAHVGMTNTAGNRIRIDIRASAGYSCFQEVRSVDRFAYIGFGQHVFVLHIDTLAVTAHELHGYFGHMYSDADLGATGSSFSVLVASASELLSFSRAGELQWKATCLGVDGVTLQSAADQLIMGEGEYDPPGGWRKFIVNQDTGEYRWDTSRPPR